MAVNESVLWTVLPDGRDRNSGGLRATIFVAPRLSGAGKLPDFDAFANWPEAIKDVTFEVEIDGIGQRPATLDPRIAKADPAMWALIFGGDVGVDDRTFNDLSERRMRSFPADEVANHVLSLYEEIAVDHPFDFPPVTMGPLADLAEDIGRIGDHREELYQGLDRLFGQESSGIAEGRKGRYIPASAVPAAARRRFAFMQAYRFYDRFRNGQSVRSKPGPIDPAAVPPPPKPPAIDFHGYVGALGDYPYLLRQLGLAIDVIFDDHASFAGDHRIRAVVRGNTRPWMELDVARPWTNYELTDRFFLPRSRHKFRDFVDGQIQLRSDFYAIHQIDIDGSAMKTMNVAASALHVKEHLAATQPSMTPDESALPALRSTGFTIVRRNRAEQVVENLDTATIHDGNETQGTPADLFTEDLTRGYRLDVELDGSGKFLSLCERTGTYVMKAPGGDVPLAVPPDEGYSKAASTTGVPDDKELYLHEAVVSWGGWSLVAKRPGLTVDTEEEHPNPPAPQPVDPGLPLVTSFNATPGTLPRLRYGTPYRFRVRLVDLAGNSVRRDEIDDERASAMEPFWRWEPVPSPAVLPRRPYSEGESQLRMVIRSTFDVDTATYTALPRIVGLAGHTDPTAAYEVTNDRWIAAPKTSQQMAELHGVFDDAIGKGLPQAAVDAAFNIAGKESGVLPPMVPADTLSLPYLPEVSGRGVALTSLPNDPQSVPTRHIEWPRDDEVNLPWWDRQPFRIRIEEGPAAGPVVPVGPLKPPVWDPVDRVLTVFLPQAEMVTLRLSSYMAPGDLSIQGMYNRIFPSLNAAQRAGAEQGRMWMFTPWQTLVLVHAVEKPLLAPVVDVAQSGMQRNLGETFCVLAGSIDNHAKSTGRLDVEAAWTEQVDDLANPDGPEDGIVLPVRVGHSHVADFNLEATENDCRVGRDDKRPVPGLLPAVHKLRHELGDTKHRVVDYHSIATTRFREYFPPEIVEGVDEVSGERLVERVGPLVSRHVPSSRRPDPPEIAYIIPTFRWDEEVTRQRPRRGPGGIAVPLFPTTTRTRSSGGLRIYLKRPWYSSGDGELLGVVLTDQPWITWPIDIKAGLEATELVRAQADEVAQRLFDRGLVRPKGRAGLRASERFFQGLQLSAADLAAEQDSMMVMKKLAGSLAAIDLELAPIFIELFGGMDPDKLVTRWGSDPAWGSAHPAAGPFIHQFPLRSAVRTGLSLAETSKAKVTVVGHTPQYDKDRGLWYCDVQIEAGSSYMPMVRLGLCRYQPWSIDNAHISRVVVSDFIQLPPQRTASIRVGRGTANVSVSGPAGYTQLATQLTGSPTSILGLHASRRVSVQLQQLAQGGDPDLGWTDIGDEVDLDATLTEAGLNSVKWLGSLPIAPAPAGASQRVLVREYELLETDPDTDDPLDATRVVLTGPLEARFIHHVRERLVYADHLSV